jgi:integrase
MEIRLLKQRIGQGKVKLVLEYEPPLASTIDGHMVDRERLDFEIYEKPRTEREELFNKMILDRAEKIRQYRMESIESGKISLYRNMSELGFVDFYKRSAREMASSSNYTAGLKYFRDYTKDFCPFNAVNRNLFIGYRDFLISKTQEEVGALNVNTAKGYFNQFRMILRMAFMQGLVKADYSDCDEIIHEVPHKEMYYIQRSHIHALNEVDCSIPDIKNMCFFLLLTRFRIGEIWDLDWSDVIRFPDERPFIMKKLTGKKDKIRLYISGEAMKYLGRPKKSGRIFKKMSYVYARNRLREWVSSAGLPGELVTFESFRRGFDTIESFL